MPTITVDLSDLNRLLGEDHTLRELRKPLQNLGIEVEGMTRKGLKLEVFHNRPDLLGVEGIARALKGYLGIETGMPKYELLDAEIKTIVDPMVTEIRPEIVMGVVENADFDESSLKAIMDIQDQLHKILGRDREKISMGTYDIKEIEPPIHFTTTKPDDEGFVPLEFDEKLSPGKILEKHPKGREYGHLVKDFDRYPLLTDSEGQVLSMPPIINSDATRVTTKTEKFGIDVTGADRKTVSQALKILMSAAAERGFKIRAVKVEYPNKTILTPDIERKTRTFNIESANEKLGIDLDLKEGNEIMERMRYDVIAGKDGDIKVQIPFYRFDIMHEVDLFEDIAIGFGYDKLNPSLPSIETSGETHPSRDIEKIARNALTGLGLMEVMPYMLTSEELNFDLMNTEGDAVTIKNPISKDYSILRTWLLPSLMEVLKENQHNELPQEIFEVGDVVLIDEKSEMGAKNVTKAAAAVIGEKSDFTYSRSLAEALLRELKVEFEVKPYKHPSLLNERAAEFLVDGEHTGFVGEVHPEVILNFELNHPISIFEVELPTG